MIPDEKTDNVGQQELIELLYRMTKIDEETMTTTDANKEPEIIILEENPATEEGEIITLDDEDEDQKKDLEDGEITGESEESEVKFHRNFV